MRLFKSVIYVIFSLAIIINFTGCDHTDLTGEVIIPQTQIKVGNTIPIKLKVPEDLSDIYWVMWTAEPKEKVEIIEGEQLVETFSPEKLEQLFGSKELNPDRIALLTAKEKGECKIYVDGYYKQTNPQGITDIIIEIVE